MNFGWLDRIEERKKGEFQAPNLYEWDTPLSGAIDIKIDANGRWWHEGAVVVRRRIVDLFISVLRAEGDNYYLVTPAEKWQIKVEDAPIIVVDLSLVGRELVATLENGFDVVVSKANPVYVSESSDGIYLTLEHGLHAKFNRASFYRAIELAGEKMVLRSGDFSLTLN